MSNSSITLRVANNVTYIDGKLDSSIYRRLKKCLGYRPEESFWMIKASQEKGQEKWRKEWDGYISAVCYNKHFCKCFIKKTGTHFHTGLLSKASQFFKDHNVPFQRVDIREKTESNNLLASSGDYEERKYQIEAISRILDKDRGVIKIATGGGKCINRDSLCLTEDGLLTFDELIDKDMIEGECLSFKKNIFTPLSTDKKDITSCIYYDGISEISYEISTSFGYNLKGTPNHQIKVLTSSGLQWKKLSDIKNGDYAAISIKNDYFGKNNVLDIDDGYFLGLLYGDGCLTMNNLIKLTTQDDHIEKSFVNYANNRGYKVKKRFDKRTKNTRSLYIYSKSFRKELENIGVGYDKSYKKYIPRCVRESRKEVVSAFLRGLFETDGFVTIEKSKPTVCICLSSKKMIDQIHLLLLNFGIVSSMRCKKTHRREAYILSVYRDFIPAFNNNISFDVNGYKHKQLKIAMSMLECLKSNTNTNVFPNLYIYLFEIRDIIKKMYGYYKFSQILTSIGIKRRTFYSWIHKDGNGKAKRKPSKKNIIVLLNWIFSLQESGYYADRLKEISRSLMFLIDNFFFDKVVSKVQKESDNFDFVIPESKSFVAQGFVNHNTLVASRVIAERSVFPTIFYVTSVDLLIQAKDEIERIVCKDNKPVEVGMIGGGYKKIRDINVMTVQTAVRALGGKYIKYDDEDVEKDDTEIDEVREDIRNLIMDCRLMFSDEIQYWSCETCQIISDASLACQYKYGMSIFPENFIELRGRCFGRGEHCAIEEAWNRILYHDLGNFYRKDGYEIVDISGVESRGWGKDNFTWNPLKKIIRHINNKKSFSIRFAGAEKINMTEDHSIYKIENNDITSCSPNNLKSGDCLLLDNGNNFESKQDILTALDILSLEPGNMRVALDLSIVSAEKLCFSKTKYYQLIRRGEIARKYGGSLYLKEYLKFKDILPLPKWIYVEGGNDTGISADLSIKDISYLVGFYIGDGWLDNTRVNFAVEKSFLEDFLINLNNVNKIRVNAKIREGYGESYEVRCSCRPFADFIRFYFKGQKCFNKRIPNVLLFGEEKIRRELLNGLIDSDGSRKRSKKQISLNCISCNFITTSVNLKRNFCLLLRSLNVSYTLSERKPALGGVIKGRRVIGKRISYQISWSDNALDGNNNGKCGNVKKTNINCIEKRVLDVSVINNSGSGYVYDLEMEGHPSFVANGVLVHNSATPYRDRGDDILIEGCFGKTIVDINASYLIREGYLVRPHITFIPFNPGRLGLANYNNIYKNVVVENVQRNNIIANLAIRLREKGGNVLVLLKQISHGKLLEEIIPDSVFLHGVVSNKKRQEQLEKIRKGGQHITLSSTIFDQGIDCKALDCLILAGSGKSPTRALQRIGRTLRPFENKKAAFIFDFDDHCKFLKKHSKERKKIYKTEEEFIIK